MWQHAQLALLFLYHSAGGTFSSLIPLAVPGAGGAKQVTSRGAWAPIAEQ